MATIASSITWVAAGSRLAVGSSRKSTWGLSAQERAKRQPLLLAEGEHARRHPREGAEAGALQRLPDQPPTLGPGEYGAGRARSRCWRRPSGAA